MKKKVRKDRTIRLLNTTFRAIELIPNLLFMALYILAVLSPFISPLKTQIPAFLNLAFPLILAGLVLLWLFYLLRRKWIYFGCYTALFLLPSSYIFTYFPIHFNKGLQKEHDLRVMSYNVQSFLGRDEAGTLLAPQLIKSYDPDILALQEANLYPDQFPTDGKLRSLFSSYPYRHVHKTQAILSKLPIKAVEDIEYESSHNGSCGYLIELEKGGTLLLVNNHLESYSLNSSEVEEYKGYIKDFSIRDLPRQFMKVKRRLGPRLNQRASVAGKVRKDVEKLQSKYQPEITIIVGDLNDTPMSYTYSQLRSRMRDAYSETGLGLSVSFNERLMPFRIDHLFYEGEIKAIGSSIPKYKLYSDHNPLIVDFKWN